MCTCTTCLVCVVQYRVRLRAHHDGFRNPRRNLPIQNSTISFGNSFVLGKLTQMEMAEATTKIEAMPAEAAIESKNSILEVGNSMLNAIVLAFSPRAPLSSGPSSAPADALSSARTVQAAAKL